jgi:hypothetical protein
MRALRGQVHRTVLTSAAALTPMITTGLQIPLEIYKWLAALKLLQGVPFRYLVPDAAMLPPESIRFFHLDMNWVDALIDGALSIGRTGPPTSPEATHDKAVQGLLQGKATVQARQLRPLALGVVQPARVAAMVAQTTLQAAPQPLEEVSGFVIRSQVVKGWPGLEVNGYAPDGSLLDIVRFERLAPTVLLCLFEKNGKTLSRLDIHEPAEGLHFGLSDQGQNVNLRYNYNAGGDLKPGSQVPGVNQPATWRGDDKRVLRMLRLARDLLAPKYGQYIHDVFSGFDHLPSSQFAMQMLRGVGLVTFKLDGSASS